jgi:hypothetical protein
MSDEPKPLSERARKRATGKTRRELSIKRREAYFDLLVSGYSIEQIATAMKTSRRRSVASSVWPWPSGGSTRRRTMLAFRSRG